MYGDFRVHDRWTGEEVHCMYQALIVAIATRHADAIDIKFLANGRPVWIAMPHPAWVEYNKRTGKVISDPLAVEIAGHYLKWAIESGEDGGREMYALSVTETLEHLDAVQKEHQSATRRRTVRFELPRSGPLILCGLRVLCGEMVLCSPARFASSSSKAPSAIPVR